MSQESRTARIEARIAPETLAIVKRAAEMEGRSVSDFIVSAAQDAARRTIEDHAVIRLSVEDQARFVDLLLDPPEPSDALRRAKEAHEALIVETR
ncbi:DUF1778 domain-containing protein [Methylobrevis pamukkalensis]|uniref:DUF1778 domain-containing protein n=1 Tax=Methylobrevis pamukkalensis TaxID=1439726 RepID=A0A1E3H6R7_9HYPH|nr:DUF1778 domain-containing protein [Methylobrevis pamukkalensis]ODN72013.1 hypothetical protein A6302_00638 [Methylobrevis pamukkalensis]